MSTNIYDCIKLNYAGVISTGFELDQIENILLTPEQKQKLIITCLHNKNKFQILAINDEAIEQVGKKLNLNNEIVSQLKTLPNNHLMSPEDFKKMLIDLNKDFEKLYQIWEQSGLGNLQLTTVGIALAHANIKKTINIDLDLSIWIK